MRLKENYDDRVEAVKNTLVQQQTFKSKDDLLSAIKDFSNTTPEFKLGGTAWKDFVKDVYHAAKPHIKIVRADKGIKKGPKVPWRDPELLHKVAWEIQAQAGNAFPDGDPFDALMPIVRKMGVGEWDVGEVLDAAAKKHLGVKSYNDYIADMWDDVHADKGHGNPDLYRAMGGDKGENPWRSRNESIKEALDEYDFKIEKAIASILGIEDDQAQEVSKKMDFGDYLDFALAVDRGDNEEAASLLQKYYAPHSPEASLESIAQEMHYRIRSRDNNVITPGFKMLGEMLQRQVLSEMKNSELQKILANLRGYENAGVYESSLFTVHLVEEIVRRAKDVKIARLLELAPIGTTPTVSHGKQQNDTSQERMDPRTAVSITNDDGQAEDGEVVTDTGQQVTVRSKSGKVERKDKAAVMKKVEEEFGVKTPNIGQIAQSHGVGIQQILDQLDKGMKVEAEHSKDKAVAMEIALDHLAERPDYYDRLERVDPHEGLAEVIRLKELSGIKK